MIGKVKLPNEKLSGIKMGGGIRDIMDLANRLEKEGKRIYHLEIGRPDFRFAEGREEGRHQGD